VFPNQSETVGITTVGEFTMTTNDCALFLNGIGKGARWDGTYQGSEPAHHGATCNGSTDVKTLSHKYIGFLHQFFEKQMNSFEKGGGFVLILLESQNRERRQSQWDYFLDVVSNSNNRHKHKTAAQYSILCCFFFCSILFI
jgi:glucan 1,3-beta-glucosidase